MDIMKENNNVSYSIKSIVTKDWSAVLMPCYTTATNLVLSLGRVDQSETFFDEKN
jgi:hypothetical protein